MLAIQIAVTAPYFLTLDAEKCGSCIMRAVKSLDHRLTCCADTTPVADKRNLTEQCRLNGQHVEATHVLRPVDPFEMKRVFVGFFHARIVAAGANIVQRLI